MFCETTKQTFPPTALFSACVAPQQMWISKGTICFKCVGTLPTVRRVGRALRRHCGGMTPSSGGVFVVADFCQSFGQSCHFFFLSCPHFSLFLSLSGCFLVEFWWCFRRPDQDPQMCALGIWLSCEAPLQTRRHPETQKKRKWGERGGKSEIVVPTLRGLP